MEIPWKSFKNNIEVANHAAQEAQKRVDANKLSFATYGGPGLYSYSDGGAWIEEQGVEVIQLAGCETTTAIEIWGAVYNAYLRVHADLVYDSREDGKSLYQLIEESYKINKY